MPTPVAVEDSFFRMKSPENDPAHEAESHQNPRLRPIFYLSVSLSLLHAFQYGWSTSQLNYTAYNDDKACQAEPVQQGTCVLFPGHSKLDWTFMVNAWIFGGMIGSLGSGYPADALGRRLSIILNSVVMILGALLQAFSTGVWMFVIGRFVSGLASGNGTAVLGSYLSEIAPPHRRGSIVSCIQVAVVLGIFLVSITFYVADTSLGARVNAGFPALLGVLTLFFSKYLVESPSWLLAHGKGTQARHVLSQMFGPEHVDIAMSWTSQPHNLETPSSKKSSSASESSLHQLFTVYRRQIFVAIGCSACQQLSGINAVFYYSSDIFQSAGVQDVRVGNLIVNTVNALPTFCIGYLLPVFQKRKLMLLGLFLMGLSAIGITIALISDLDALTILFTAVYVAAFACSLGPLVWGITAELLPDHIRARGQSICLLVNWTCNLLVGISYPYIADALDDYGFVPFLALLAVFFVFVYRCLPETYGKTMDEIQAEFTGVYT
uniref:Hexose transporter 1 n=1 Tax=Albugo laibachii Nc14 TaxID=890382 RepID=F0WCS7_9STRA|nr:glucose transporter putative [Albugo laibachii Nc14]|eukprot:CCA18996.1 glucose transporter putative [Albugo laibachii Nc14]